MTAVHHYTLRCDHDGCVSRFSADDNRAESTRRAAAGRGWSEQYLRVALTRRLVTDLCPLHGEAMADFTPPASVPHLSCTCDARGHGGPCCQHPPPALWTEVAQIAARMLLSSSDAQLASATDHVKIALELLGYKPKENR